MPLTNASDPPSDDFSATDTPFPDSSPDDTPYPSPSPLAPLSSLLGYTEDDRQRYITTQQANTSRLLGLDLTPHERAGLAYYNSIFYTYESYGDVLGTSTGLLLGYALRNRKPGPITNTLSRALGQSASPRATKLIGTALKLLAFGAAGRMYGLTSAGLQALNRMRAEQHVDPAMQRVVGARAVKIGALERERRALNHLQHPAAAAANGEGGGEGEGDEQSLGGMEIADQQRRDGEAVAREHSRAFPFGRPSEKVGELRREQPESGGGGGDGDGDGDGDPFAFSAGGGGSSSVDGGAGLQQERPQKGAWRNMHSNTRESTWERLRRGQAPVARDAPADAAPDEGAAGGPWAAKGEPKTDSFSFSRSAEERELAKAQAQKEFDESVERERRSSGSDGYTEGDKGGRRWRD